ncbi:YcxB family protein [Streptomyces sp. NPDC096339]|uniref:YcxB family protein n=1 Tax=Streptomyces sp. NPDC096339 TaxID=3366086 RepID=UPI003803166E
MNTGGDQDMDTAAETTAAETTAAETTAAETTAAEAAAVELVYRPTPADVAAGIRARWRFAPSARRQRWTLPLLAVILFAMAANKMQHGMTLGDRGVYLQLVIGTTLLAMLFLAPRLGARRVHKALVEKQGEFRAVVTETGATVGSTSFSQSLTWAMVPRYTETPEAFVLLSADKYGAGITVLPKRGAQDPADVDRLRTLLDRHIERVGKAPAQPV